MKRIISAFAVLAVVGGALAFSPNTKAYQCQNAKCIRIANSVFVGGPNHIDQGAITTANLDGLPCTGNCLSPIDYTPE